MTARSPLAISGRTHGKEGGKTQRTLSAAGSGSGATGDEATAPMEDEGFFVDEIRGYQLLRYARLSGPEKQTLLAYPRNSTSFATIRAALLTWWEKEDEVRTRCWWRP